MNPPRTLIVLTLLILTGCGQASQSRSTAPVPQASAEPEIVQPPQETEAQTAGREREALLAQTRSENPVIRKRGLAALAFFERDQGNLDRAAELLDQAAEVYPELRPFLLMKLVEVDRERGEQLQAMNAAERIQEVAPGTAAAELARLRLPALVVQAGHPEQLEERLASTLRVSIDELNEPELVETADTLESEGYAQAATAIRFALLTRYPRGRDTEQTWQKLMSLPDAGNPILRMSFPESLELADHLGRVNRHPLVLELLDRLSDRFPDRRDDPQLRWIRALSLFGSRQYDKVVQLRAKPGEPYSLALDRLRGHAFWRLDRNDEFIRLMKEVIARAPSSSEATSARLLLGKYYLIDGDDPARAASYLQSVIDAGHPGSDGENIWTLAWIYISSGDNSRALKTIDTYLARFPDADYTSNSLFWAAKVRQRMGELQQRDTLLQRLISFYPYSYYSYRARAILGLPTTAPARVAEGVRFPVADAREKLATDPRLDVVRELEAIGLDEEATRQYRLLNGLDDDPLLAWGLAQRYARTGEPLKAIILLHREFPGVIRHGSPDPPDDFWRILYPLPWKEQLESAAAGRVDSFLAAAVIRQESAFEPSTVSRAGAVGLMQIMPEEAARIASRAGLGPVDRQALFDPETNLKVGAAELQQKIEAMDGDVILAIAAYNAGETAVGRWIANAANHDIDQFIESIPFNETRLYVKNVLRNYYEYRRTYGQEREAPETSSATTPNPDH